MKIGTDGVLLGAWSEIDPLAKKVLDIGTGTGLIALMLAQRFSAISIDAIELDQAAAAEASFNFSESPWSKRLNCIAISLQDYHKTFLGNYDHIVCNPPFYQGTYSIMKKERDQARNILPIEYEEMATQEAEKHQLYLKRFTAVKGNKHTAFKRALLSYSRRPSDCESTELVLEKGRHDRTPAHQALVKDFYLPKP